LSTPTSNFLQTGCPSFLPNQQYYNGTEYNYLAPLKMTLDSEN